MIIQIISKNEIIVDGEVWVKPKKKKAPKKKKIPKTWSIKLAEELQQYFSIEYDKTNAALCFENIVRIDKEKVETIRVVCQLMRRDDFWKKNFHSPLKLRRKDESGTKYIHKFMAILKTKYEGSSTAKKQNISDLVRNSELGAKVG